MQWGGGATGRGSIFKRTAQASAASDAGAAPGYHGTMLRTLCLLVLLLASSCFAATFYVNVTASAFVPQSLSIQEGDIVVWSWNNGAGWYARLRPHPSLRDQLSADESSHNIIETGAAAYPPSCASVVAPVFCSANSTFPESCTISSPTDVRALGA